MDSIFVLEMMISKNISPMQYLGPEMTDTDGSVFNNLDTTLDIK